MGQGPLGPSVAVVVLNTCPYVCVMLLLFLIDAIHYTRFEHPLSFEMGLRLNSEREKTRIRWDTFFPVYRFNSKMWSMCRIHIIERHQNDRFSGDGGVSEQERKRERDETNTRT